LVCAECVSSSSSDKPPQSSRGSAVDQSGAFVVILGDGAGVGGLAGGDGVEILMLKVGRSVVEAFGVARRGLAAVARGQRLLKDFDAVLVRRFEGSS